MRLSGLDAGEPLSLDVLPYADALALFDAVAGSGRVAAEPEAADEVVRACGLLPLAVQIAAARLRHRPAWSVAHLRDRLAVEDRRLDELAAEDRSVAAAFALSYRSLDAARRRMFRLLGLFPGAEIGLPAAAALAAVERAEADRLLQDLVDCQLLDEPRTGRYRPHDLLGVYAARECARTESERDRSAALDRLFDFYLATVDGAEELLRPQRLDRADAAAPGSRRALRRPGGRAGLAGRGTCRLRAADPGRRTVEAGTGTRGSSRAACGGTSSRAATGPTGSPARNSPCPAPGCSATGSPRRGCWSGSASRPTTCGATGRPSTTTGRRWP